MFINPCFNSLSTRYGVRSLQELQMIILYPLVFIMLKTWPPNTVHGQVIIDMNFPNSIIIMILLL